ncbi:MAG: histidine phosphatase family protein [Nitrospinae bacterium]|nr:histidine phosphatase family protein [Nitrospinota bacterium]
MDLILWRHAEAEDGFPDEARKLTPKGQKQAEKVGAWLKERLPENTTVLSSPAKRTQMTASALTDKYSVTKELGSGADAERVLDAAGWPDADGAVVVVGHQPTLGEVAARLLSKNSFGGMHVRKGQVWWFDNRDGVTTLKAVLPPSLL